MLWFLILPLIFIALCLAFSIPLGRRHQQQIVDSPVNHGLRFEEVEFKSEDGILLKGWWIPATGAKRCVIFLHGYGGSCDPDLKYVPDFNARGFNVLMFDFRAHGRSGGNFTSIGALEVRDCQAAIQHARQQGSQYIGLLGFSLGGRTALLAAAHGTNVQALISDCGPARLVTAVEGDLELKKVPHLVAKVFAWMAVAGLSLHARVNLFKEEPLYLTTRLNGLPVLLIQGARDRYIRMKELEQMVKNAGAECWVVPEASHRNIEKYRPEEYLPTVLDFFDRWLPEK